MNVLDYKAKIMFDKLNNIPNKTIEDWVLERLESGETLKKEEIDSFVSLKTGITADKDLQGEVSSILATMEKEGLVSHPMHGYWRKIQ